jgi:uncharacterized membrane-anchored protein
VPYRLYNPASEHFISVDQTPAINLNKVPEVTLVFWIIKICATTLGETGGDAVTMTMHLGYAIGSAIFLGFFAVIALAQIRARSFHPFLYWAVIIATTTAGTTMADFADRSLGVGYTGGSLILATLLIVTLVIWRLTLGTVAVDHIASPRAEMFYWTAILFSNTLGTALGDFFADDSGLGYAGGALVFASAIAFVAAAYFFTDVSHTLLFWLAFILTRPLGATLGDLLTKPYANGGFNQGRFTASAIIAAFIIVSIRLMPQRAAPHPGHA